MKIFKTILSLTLLLTLIMGCNEPDAKEAQWLFVQNSEGVSLHNGILTLQGVDSRTLFFSDRPERIAAHGKTIEFIKFWNEDERADNFRDDPPNAALSIVNNEMADDIVMTLSNPRMNGVDLMYDATVIEGAKEFDGGAASLFVDVVGMPLTPLSVAGVARRTTRRTVRRMVY